MSQTPEIQNPSFVPKDFERQISGARLLAADQINEILQLPQLANNFVEVVGSRAVELTKYYIRQVKDDAKEAHNSKEKEKTEDYQTINEKKYLERVNSLVAGEIILLADERSMQAKTNFIIVNDVEPGKILDEIAEEFRQIKINQIVLTAQSYYKNFTSDKVCLFDISKNEKFLLESSHLNAEGFAEDLVTEMLSDVAKKIKSSKLRIWQSSKRRRNDIYQSVNYNLSHLSRPEEVAEVFWNTFIYPELSQEKDLIESMLKKSPKDVDKARRGIMVDASLDIELLLTQKTVDAEFADFAKSLLEHFDDLD